MTNTEQGLGMDDNPNGEQMTPQEAIDEIHDMYRKAQGDCFAPEDRKKNLRNAGRVRALSQALVVLGRAGLEPT